MRKLSWNGLELFWTKEICGAMNLCHLQFPSLKWHRWKCGLGCWKETIYIVSGDGISIKTQPTGRRNRGAMRFSWFKENAKAKQLLASRKCVLSVDWWPLLRLGDSHCVIQLPAQSVSVDTLLLESRERSRDIARACGQHTMIAWKPVNALNWTLSYFPCFEKHRLWSDVGGPAMATYRVGWAL